MNTWDSYSINMLDSLKCFAPMLKWHFRLFICTAFQILTNYSKIKGSKSERSQHTPLQFNKCYADRITRSYLILWVSYLKSLVLQMLIKIWSTLIFKLCLLSTEIFLLSKLISRSWIIPLEKRILTMFIL